MPCIYTTALCWFNLVQGLCTYTAVGVDAAGLVNPDDVVAAITPNTVLVTVMHSNNEVRGQQASQGPTCSVYKPGCVWAMLFTSAAGHAAAPVTLAQICGKRFT